MSVSASEARTAPPAKPSAIARVASLIGSASARPTTTMTASSAAQSHPRGDDRSHVLAAGAHRDGADERLGQVGGEDGDEQGERGVVDERHAEREVLGHAVQRDRGEQRPTRPCSERRSRARALLRSLGDDLALLRTRLAGDAPVQPRVGDHDTGPRPPAAPSPERVAPPRW